MTRIWSGRLQDQVYAGMAERLVRQSNNARLDPNVGVNPRVRRILARMHRAGLLENMAGLWLPDMYTADGENRVERMGGLTAQGALEQETAGDRPTLTRDDERSNLLLQSIWPGSGDEPTGWSVTIGSNGSLEEGTDGHQDYLFTAADELTQGVPVLSGQQYLIAVRAEIAASSVSDVVDGGGVSMVSVGSNSDMAEVSDGDWLWQAVAIEANGTMTVEINGDTGDRLSRPALHYLPPGWMGLSEEARQAWLSSHYAASDTLPEYAGLAGIRGAHCFTDQQIIGPTINLNNHSAFSFFVLMNCHRDGEVEAYQRLSTGNGTRFLGQSGGAIRARVVMTGSNHNLDIAPTGGRRSQWILYGMSATVGGQFFYSQNGAIVDSTSIPNTAFADSSWGVEINAGSANFSLAASTLSLGKSFDASEHAALHEILTETP